MATLETAAVFTEGDTYAVVRINTGENLTGFTAATMHASDIDQGVDYASITGVIADAANGVLTFNCAATLASSDGVYRCRYTVTDSNSLVQTGPDFQVVTKPKVEDLAP